MKKTMLAALAAATLLASGGLQPAQAQKEPPYTEPKDDRWLAALAKREKSVILFTLVLANPNGKMSCAGAKMHIRPVGEKGKPMAVHSSGILIKPGRYDIVAVTCSSGNNRGVYNGPHARIDAPAGQVVDAGALRLEYDVKSDGLFTGTGTGTLKKSVVDFPADKRARIKEELPKVMARAVTRHMTLIGPATINVKQRTRF